MRDDVSLYSMCRVATNEDGNTFVGVTSENDELRIVFPIGYAIPKDENVLSRDIFNLLDVLTEFSEKDTEIKTDKFDAPQSVDFPIHSYLTVIFDFVRRGDYYRETVKTYHKGSSGQQDWERTFTDCMPLIQRNNTAAYLETVNVRQSPDISNKLTLINKFCVHVALKKLGRLFGGLEAPEPDNMISNQEALTLINKKLNNCFQDQVKNLFLAMRAIIDHIDRYPESKIYYFGTERFHKIWEKLIDRIFGEENKDDYLPVTRWTLDYDNGKDRTKRPLIPDSIMIYNEKFYVLDAKLYKYGRTKKFDDLPNGTDINKQITYGEYVKEHHQDSSVFNAFLIPYNKEENKFGISGNNFLRIGEATGDWRPIKTTYNLIQGILVDTRYIMNHYDGGGESQKSGLSVVIEAAFKDRKL